MRRYWGALRHLLVIMLMLMVLGLLLTYDGPNCGCAFKVDTLATHQTW
jgi:hypothetical protein